MPLSLTSCQELTGEYSIAYGVKSVMVISFRLAKYIFAAITATTTTRTTTVTVVTVLYVHVHCNRQHRYIDTLLEIQLTELSTRVSLQ